MPADSVLRLRDLVPRRLARMVRAEVRWQQMQRMLKRQPSLLVFTLVCCCVHIAAQTAPANSPSLEEIQKLAVEQRWHDIAQLLEPLPARTADMDFYYGTAQARLQNWSAAVSAFEAGRSLAPRDPRFPVELAGVAFKQKRYEQAAHSLRRAIQLNPHDSYTNNFLGTVYFLQGNVEASLKYWNRADKPEVAEIHEQPLPGVSPALLDRAFAFSPAGTLQLSQFLDTNVRLQALQIFPRYRFDLQARDDGKFDVQFRSQERDGFGHTKLEAPFLLLRGLPFFSVDPEYYNLHRQAINLISMYRWDAQKRRVVAQFSSPFEHSAKVRYDVGTDLRDENWVIRNSFAGPAPVLGSVNLRREQLTFDLASHANWRWNWSAGAEVSHRDFRSVDAGTALTPMLLARGYQLKQRVQLGAPLWRFPERRFTVDAGVSSQAARLWSQPEESFEKLQGSLSWHWFPKSEGDDYAMQQQVRAGGTLGTAPFDELFTLGLERDNDLSMRGHIGTRDGRKGSAPLGRNYVLSNWEMDKNLYGSGIVAVKIGPFVDTGRIFDSITGSQKWLCDIGAQAKLRVFGSGVVFSYGKDLRSGNNAFYVTVLKKSEAGD